MFDNVIAKPYVSLHFSVIRAKVRNERVIYFWMLILKFVYIGPMYKSSKHLFEKIKKKILTPWIQYVNRLYVRRSEDVQDVFLLKSYVRLIRRGYTVKYFFQTTSWNAYSTIISLCKLPRNVHDVLFETFHEI